MQVSVETTSGLERRMTISVPAERVDSAVEERLKKAAKTVRINGFRKGKVPLKVVKKQFGAGVRQEVLGELFGSSFYEAVAQESLKPAGQPSIEPIKLEEGADVEFAALFEVFPEIEVADLSELQIDTVTAEVKDSDIDNMIEVLRKQQATWAVVEREAKDGDQVKIDFAGKKDGELFEGGSAEGQNLVLGSGQMIPGFESGIEGMKAGEEKVLELTFPEEYHNEELKGAAVEFAITLHEVSEQVLPEVNAEFFAKFGIETEDEGEFRTEISQNMKRELDNAIAGKTKAKVMDGLQALHSFDVPKALIANEIQALRQQMAQQFGGQQLDASMLPDELFQGQAEKRIQVGLVVAELVSANDIQVDADRVKAKVEEVASTYQDPEEVINYYYSNKELLGNLESAVLEDQIVDFVLEKAAVTTSEVSYDDAIKPEAPAEAE